VAYTRYSMLSRVKMRGKRHGRGKGQGRREGLRREGVEEERGMKGQGQRRRKGPQTHCGCILTFSRSCVTLSGMCPFDTPGAISHRCSIVTESVSHSFLRSAPKLVHTHTDRCTKVKTVYPPVSLRKLGGYNNTII